jgi:hypothetical protein
MPGRTWTGWPLTRSRVAATASSPETQGSGYALVALQETLCLLVHAWPHHTVRVDTPDLGWATPLSVETSQTETWTGRASCLFRAPATHVHTTHGPRQRATIHGTRSTVHDGPTRAKPKPQGSSSRLRPTCARFSLSRIVFQMFLFYRTHDTPMAAFPPLPSRYTMTPMAFFFFSLLV